MQLPLHCALLDWVRHIFCAWINLQYYGVDLHRPWFSYAAYYHLSVRDRSDRIAQLSKRGRVLRGTPR